VRLGAEPVGRWGLAVLAVTGVIGVVLAMHGWSARDAGLAHTSLGTRGSSGAPHAGSTPASTPSATPTVAGPSAAPQRPLLSKQPYASVAYQVWPGSPSTAAQAALTGLIVSVKRQGSTLLVTANVNGQPAQPARGYAGGARVYVVEASLGDDSNNTDYNLGDDALVVTDANGGIIQ
jgi:hypothetical protein